MTPLYAARTDVGKALCVRLCLPSMSERHSTLLLVQLACRALETYYLLDQSITLPALIYGRPTYLGDSACFR